MLLGEQRNGKQKADLSGRKQHVSAGNVVLEPTSCRQDPEGLDVAFGGDRVRRGYHHWRHPDAALLPVVGTSGLVLRSPVTGTVVAGSSFRGNAWRKAPLPRVHILVYFSYISHQLWPRC